MQPLCVTDGELTRSRQKDSIVPEEERAWGAGSLGLIHLSSVNNTLSLKREVPLTYL